MAAMACRLRKEYRDMLRGSQVQQGIQSAVRDYLYTGELVGFRQIN